MQTHQPTRQPYPSDVSDAEWAFAAPDLTLITPDAPQRRYDLREVFDAVRWLVRSGSPWRLLPPGTRLRVFPRWEIVYQPTQRWLAAGCFQAIIEDLRLLLRLAAGRNAQPSAAIFDSQPLPSTPEGESRAGYDGHKRKKGAKAQLAVATLGHRLALHVTPANQQDRAQVDVLAEAVQEATGEHVELVSVDQGSTGDVPAAAAAAHGIALHLVKLPEATHGFVLLPRRWVAERSFAGKTCFRRVVRDDERLQETVEGVHRVAFSCLMLQQAVDLLAES
jgi:transposase